MKKIIFGITSLGLGGAERVLVDLANELSKNNEYQITIITIYAQGELEKQLSSRVILKSIYNTQYNQLKAINKALKPLSVLINKNKIYKKYIDKQYDIEIAFLEGPITRIFSCGRNQKNKIAWIHNDIAQVFGDGIKAKIKRKLDERIYNKFEKLIFVSKNNLETFIKTYPNNRSEKQVIYNYIDKQKILKKAKKKIQFDETQINLLTVARLVPQKALDRLIKVHSRLIKEGINHNINIIGDGPEKEHLQQLILDYNCEKTVKLLGKKENPYPYMKKADYICLFSKFEGYGMVLEEAKILNKYILITDTAAQEAVDNYLNCKIFMNSEDGIYKGLKSVLKNPKEFINSNQQYNNSPIIEKVKQLLEMEKK